MVPDPVGELRYPPVVRHVLEWMLWESADERVAVTRLDAADTVWVLRRSTDLVPYLLAMAVRDRCRVRRPEPPVPGQPARPAAKVPRR